MKALENGNYCMRVATKTGVEQRLVIRVLDDAYTLPQGFKLIEIMGCDSYLQRMGQFPKSTDAKYLRQFAREGASALKP